MEKPPGESGVESGERAGRGLASCMPMHCNAQQAGRKTLLAFPDVLKPQQDRLLHSPGTPYSLNTQRQSDLDRTPAKTLPVKAQPDTTASRCAAAAMHSTPA